MLALIDLRATYTATAQEYENMNKAYLKELTEAQKEIVVYLTLPAA